MSSPMSTSLSLDSIDSWHGPEEAVESDEASNLALGPYPSSPLPSQNSQSVSPLDSQSRSQGEFNRPYHYEPATMTNFQVEGCIFRLDRALLDQESHMLPQAVGSKDDPIELPGVSKADFAVLIHFLYFGPQFDKKPWSASEWSSIVSVSTRYAMIRIRNLACISLVELLDPVGQIVLAQSKGIPEALVPGYAALCQRKEPLDASEVSKLGSGVTALIGKEREANRKQISEFFVGGTGFQSQMHGLYFMIREKGKDKYLGSSWGSNVEGVQLQLWTREKGKGLLGSQVFFIDAYGALCHAASGLAVDIVDDVPVLRRRRPVSSRPNPWSHPLPLFSFENSQIRVKFLSDPSLPSCTDDLYPDDSWATKDFVLATRTKKDFHMHPISDFSPWIPPIVGTSLPYDIRANHDKEWRVLVEDRTGDVSGDRTSWEIVAGKYI